MYLKGSKFNLQKQERRRSPWLMITLLVIIAALVYLNLRVIPKINPPFVPTPTVTRDPQSFVAEADQLALEGKYIQAVSIYQQAINANPRLLDNYLKIARLQIYIGQLEKAQVNAQNAILLDENSADAYSLLGWAQGFQKEYLLGESNARKAIELNPNSGLAHAACAYILALRVEAGLEELDTVNKAIEESRTALALEPQLLEANWARGYVLEITSNYAEAVTQLQAAVALNPNIAKVHMALGRNLINTQQLDQAIFEFTKAYSLNPTDPAPNLAISETYRMLGEWEKGIQYGELALKDGPTDAKLYANLGTLYFRKGEYNRSLEYFEVAVKGGKSADGQVVSGIALAYQRSVVELYSRYGLALARVNRCSEAVAVAEAMLQTIADDADGVYNANEVLKICEENRLNPPTATPRPTPTLITGPTPTAVPPTTPTP